MSNWILNDTKLISKFDSVYEFVYPIDSFNPNLGVCSSLQGVHVPILILIREMNENDKRCVR